MKLMTIRQTASHLGIPRHCLRLWLEDGILPGCYAGTRFYVDVDALKEKITSGALSEKIHESPNLGKKRRSKNEIT